MTITLTTMTMMIVVMIILATEREREVGSFSLLLTYLCSISEVLQLLQLRLSVNLRHQLRKLLQQLLPGTVV